MIEAKNLITANSLGRTFYDYHEDFFSFIGCEDPLYEAIFREATMVGSLCRDGLHAPVLDIDFSARLSRLSSSYELVLDARPEEEAVVELAKIAAEIGISREINIIEEGGGMLRIVFDCPAILVPSETPGHFHLYLETKISWQQYEKLLAALYRAGVIEEGFYGVCVRNKKSTVILPWIKRKEVLPIGY